uniref:Uncharacterized protein MANES_16G101900 n=1 Tax=Rhizophora mucronata TaxID=61149 RepID=A0A2P2KLG7_RHIMU
MEAPVAKKRGRKPKPKDEKDQQQQQQQSAGKTKEGKKAQQPSIDDKYTQWKALVPLLYDWLANHNLVWPSLSCRWGPQLERSTYKNKQRLYLSEQASFFVICFMQMFSWSCLVRVIGYLSLSYNA